MRQAIPILAQHGAILGIFSAIKRWNKYINPHTELCPFEKLGRSHSHASGCYRGLATEEANAIKKARGEQV